MGNFSNYWDLHTLFTKIKNKIKSVSDSIPTKLSDLTADATHRTVTDTEKSTWNNKSNFSGSYNDLTNKPTIPTKTSELTNNSNFVADSSYVHTDNNYTTAEKTKLSGIASGAEANVQSDWNQTTTTADDYIKNKPTSMPASDVSAWAKASTKPTYTASEVGAVATSSLPLSAANGGTGKTNLADSANALINSLSLGTSDPVDDDYYICQWANGGSSVTTYHRRPVSKLWNYIKSKLATVATSGSYNDLSNKPTIPTALSQLTADATHRLVTDTEKSTWNNKSNFSGSYNDLTNKPTIPTALSQLTADATHRLVTDTEKNTWNGKQNALSLPMTIGDFNARWSDEFGEDDYSAFSSGLQIYQDNDEHSGIGLTGNGIYMWAPPDDTCLTFYSEDSGDIRWEIDSDNTFTGYINDTHVRNLYTINKNIKYLNANILGSNVTNLFDKCIDSRIVDWTFAANASGSTNSVGVSPGDPAGTIFFISACYDSSFKYLYVVNTGGTYNFHIYHSGVFIIPSSMQYSEFDIKAIRDTSVTGTTAQTIRGCCCLSVYRMTPGAFS